MKLLSWAVGKARWISGSWLFWLLMAFFYALVTGRQLGRLLVGDGYLWDWLFLAVNPPMILACGFIAVVKLHDRLKERRDARPH